MGVTGGLGGRAFPLSISSLKGRNKGEWKAGPEEVVGRDNVLKDANMVDQGKVVAEKLKESY